MNATQHYAPTHAYLDTHHPHISHDGTASAPPAYATYQHPMLPPTQSSYGSTHAAGYHPYATTTAMAYPAAQYAPPVIPSINTLTALPQTLPAMSYPAHESDPSGQTGPPGKKTKITATLWEDENTLCFQVEANGVCVARRADNCFINGTKLLNVAHMTRGRRDGLLKSEKNRKVVKIGPMHLKGVWIPFDRALDYANKEKITDLLYPLFVHNVEAFLSQSGYHPPASASTSAATQRPATRPEYGHVRTSSTMSQAPSLHSASSSVSHMHPMSAHHVHGRPSLDRAHTFPTPPTSATTAMAPATATSFDWSNSAPQHVEHNTALANAKSLPTSPASTPPDNSLQQVHYPGAQPVYDASRPMYSMQPHYALAPAHLGYGKTEMPPPPPRKVEAAIVKDESEAIRPDSGYTVNGSESYDRPYSHHSSLSTSHHIDEQKRSPSPGNDTPRASANTVNHVAPQHHWQPTFSTPQRMMHDHRPMSASSAHHGYSASGNHSYTGSASHSYSASGGGTPQTMYYSNGYTPTPASNKRMRSIDEEEEDHYSRPVSQGGEYDGGLKRRKTVREGVDNVIRPIAQPSALSRSRSMMHQR